MSISVYKVQSTLSQVTDERVTGYLSELEAALGEPFSLISFDEWTRTPARI